MKCPAIYSATGGEGLALVLVFGVLRWLAFPSPMDPEVLVWMSAG